VCEVWQYREENQLAYNLHTGPEWPFLAPVLYSGFEAASKDSFGGAMKRHLPVNKTIPPSK